VFRTGVTDVEVQQDMVRLDDTKKEEAKDRREATLVDQSLRGVSDEGDGVAVAPGESKRRQRTAEEAEAEAEAAASTLSS
ncbi:hypothetical protein KIPB_016061, partial [Kipferlia bialata]